MAGLRDTWFVKSTEWRVMVWEWLKNSRGAGGCGAIGEKVSPCRVFCTKGRAKWHPAWVLGGKGIQLEAPAVGVVHSGVGNPAGLRGECIVKSIRWEFLVFEIDHSTALGPGSTLHMTLSTLFDVLKRRDGD